MALVDFSILFRSQLQSRRADLNRLIEVLESDEIQEVHKGSLAGRFSRLVSPLRVQLTHLEDLDKQGKHREAWEGLSEIQRRSRGLLEEAQAFLGGVAIGRTALDQNITKRAQELVQSYARKTGLVWSGAVIIGQQGADDLAEDLVVELDPGDSLIRLPIPRWDVWYLPLLAHDFGYWVAKQGQIAPFDQFVDDQMAIVASLVVDEPPAEEEVARLLPELQEVWGARRHSADLESFRKQHASRVELLAKRQKVHLWHLIADAVATYLVGPAYLYALLFLTFNPSRAFLEGGGAREAGGYRSRYLPADARRAAVVFETLRKIDESTQADEYAGGAYSSELNLGALIWNDALTVTGDLEKYRFLHTAMRPWHARIFEALQESFGDLANKASDSWLKARDELVPILETGGEEPLRPDLELVINAAWYCRPRYPDRIASLTACCSQLLNGHTLTGLQAKRFTSEREASRLLHSRFYDLETDIKRLKGLFTSPEIEQADRNAVAGRFYRLLSEQDYGVKKLQKFASGGTPLGSSLPLVIQQSEGAPMQIPRQETLDFLGGVLMRVQKLDGGISILAELLLRDYARMTGVNWASRVVLGTNPLFSPASEIVHLRFPDWEVWNLPLMAHEFGHVTAFATPAFKDLGADIDARHLHEFFADAFAVYCQGPAFAYNVILLHFNPVEAYLPRGGHPTHAERVEGILQVLDSMNNKERHDEYDGGPYQGVIKRLRDWWDQAVQHAEAKSDEVDRGKKLNMKCLVSRIYDLLDMYYRFGVQYLPDDWARAEEIAKELLDGEPDLSHQGLRDLLNIAWAARIRYPDRLTQIAKVIRRASEQVVT